jgi:putative nucleotidyltransferase with HDIG domain
VDSGDSPSLIADLLIKPFPRERFALAVDRGRQWRKEALDRVRWHAALTDEVRDRSAQICGLVQRWGLGGTREAEALAAFALERTPEVAAHGERVVRYARSIVRELGAEGSLGEALELTARFHDIGKLAMPDALMTKPSPLTAAEAAIMRQHVEVGAEILESTATLAPIAPAVRATHEWFSGRGYPYRLTGSAIPLISRIVAVADAYDAMTQERSYRPRINATDAVNELLRGTPVQFDPDIVNAFLGVLGRH